MREIHKGRCGRLCTKLVTTPGTKSDQYSTASEATGCNAQVCYLAAYSSKLECCIRSLRSRYCNNWRLQRKQITLCPKQVRACFVLLCLCAFLWLYQFCRFRQRTRRQTL